MSDDGFKADLPAIRAHSGQVQSLADRVGTAHGAAQTTMSGNAFGIFGQFLAAKVMEQGEVVKTSIDSGRKALESIKTALDHTAADYEKTDEESSAILKEVEGGFGS